MGARPDIRLALAIAAGKGAALASRALGRGGGTALPGLVALRLDPGILAKLSGRLPRGSVLVTGTNGKTTTSRMLARMLELAEVPFVHNREGSNLVRGMTSTLLAEASLGARLGRRYTPPPALGLFETDEAALLPATRALAPRAIAFTNLFRDQLDRYGEVDTVFALWREALAVAPPDTTLVLNADDPSVAELALGWGGPVHWFGLDDATFATDAAGAFDARWCRACGGAFAYERRYFAHVGWWRCAGCGRRRPAPQTTGSRVRLSLDSAAVDIDGLGDITMPLTGVYNVYNALAAVALARVLELPVAAITGGLASVRAAFGRQETVDLQGRRLRLLLCKNPAGANQVISLLAAVTAPGAALNVAVLLNDRTADGEDVSWTWDVDYERLSDRVARCWAGGDRAEDMALRLKYAGWPVADVAPRPRDLLDALIAGTPPGADAFVLPTYTAMLALRRELARRGATTQFWDRRHGA